LFFDIIIKMEKEKTFYARNRKEWRDWLEKNHDKEKKIALIKYKKHTGKPSLSHKESMEEAICFGWIDTTIKKLDEDRYLRRFARRNDKSRWSDNTLSYGKKLVKEGKMHPAGMKRYLEGLSRPTHDAGISKNPSVPEDLKKELRKKGKAEENFAAFPRSYKRMYLRWIERAKLSETRKKRIGEVVKRALENKKKWN
jgi:uncharacterized protein YdeI (YjbR/CyaY-like superfamily)